MTWAILAGCILVSYVLGSIPTGLIVGLRVKKLDIREHGSKNIGATNTLRVLGWQWGLIALLGDMAKGGLAVALGYVVVASFMVTPSAPLLCGVAAIAGHTFSIFLRFKGGKGVATSAGVFLALAWQPTVVALVVFVIVVAVTRMVSAASIAAAATLGATAFFFPTPIPALPWLILAVSVLVILRHRTNIARIFAGTESRLGRKKA